MDGWVGVDGCLRSPAPCTGPHGDRNGRGLFEPGGEHLGIGQLLTADGRRLPHLCFQDIWLRLVGEILAGFKIWKILIGQAGIACSVQKRNRTNWIGSQVTSSGRMWTTIGHLTHRELSDWDFRLVRQTGEHFVNFFQLPLGFFHGWRVVQLPHVGPARYVQLHVRLGDLWKI